MSSKKLRAADILGIERNHKDLSLIKNVVVAAKYIPTIQSFAFRCPFCNQVHTINEPLCKDTNSYLYVTDHHGRERKLDQQWQIIVQIQDHEHSYRAGDLSEWLRSRGLE